MNQELRILMLEDDVSDADLNKAQLLQLEEYNCLVDLVSDKASYLKAIQNCTYDIILSDYNLPQYNGLEALNDLRKVNQLIPFIFVTGKIDEETAANTIKAGAWDYVLKDRLFRLPLALKSALQLKDERIHKLQAEEKNHQLSMAIEQSPVSVVVCNIEYKIEYVNRRFVESTGFLPEEVLGKDIFNLTPENKRNEIIKLFKKDFEKLKNWKGETQSLKKDGSIFWEHLSVSPIKNEDGKITHFVAIKEDISFRKKMEHELFEALNRAERSDKLKDIFLQNLSHEIRTPLNAIIGFSDLLQNDKEKDKNRIEEYTKIISNSSSKLLSIMTDVLTIASIQTGQETVVSQMVDINLLFDKLYRTYLSVAKQKNLDFVISKDRPDLPFFSKTDETKLEQILLNLLNNAFKFTHSGKVELRYFVVGDFIEFYVKDTGIGIQKEFLDDIFERFRQANDSISTKYGGTGLGLSIAKSYAQMLDGTLSVESEVHKGSVFCLTLPYISIDSQHAQASAVNVSLINRNLNILIAEDELNNFLLLEAFLLTDDVTVIRAKNGLEAINICKNDPSVNLVLMDIKMPVVDGEVALLEIKKIRPDLPIIAQTAYALEEEKQHFLDIGFDGYIAKPITQKDLLEKINAVLELMDKS